MNVDVNVITDDSTRHVIEQALTHVNRAAKACKPSPRKDELHTFINQLLDKWEAAQP